MPFGSVVQTSRHRFPTCSAAGILRVPEGPDLGVRSVLMTRQVMSCHY